VRMEKILLFRQKLRQLYSSWDLYIVAVIKFGIALLAFRVMAGQIGWSAFLIRWDVDLILALLCALIPWKLITAVMAVTMLCHMLALSLISGALALLFVGIAAMCQMLFIPGYSIVIILLPIAYFLKIPTAVPLVLGLVGGISGFVPAAFGVFFYYFVATVQKNMAVLTDTTLSKMDTLQSFVQILTGLRDNNLLFVSVITFVLVVILVSLIRRLPTDHSGYIAVSVGTVVSVVLFLLGSMTLEITLSYVSLFLGTLVSFVIAMLAAFWFVAADFNRTEYLQYEDGEYVYYVKAVPKINVARAEKKLSEINARVPELDQEDADLKAALKILEKIDEEEKEQ